EIDYLNEKYKWDIPEGDYDTLGGFILSITESIPEVHDIIKHGLFEIKVVSMEDARIDNVLFIYNPDQED
ncbi:transporter associated domain-containing protein, partial [Roseivirga sp.]